MYRIETSILVLSGTDHYPQPDEGIARFISRRRNPRIFAGVVGSPESAELLHNRFQHYFETDTLCKGWSESAAVSMYEGMLLITSYLPGARHGTNYHPKPDEEIILGDLGLEPQAFNAFLKVITNHNPVLPVRRLK